jgi:hypothetical protein
MPFIRKAGKGQKSEKRLNERGYAIVPGNDCVKKLQKAGQYRMVPFFTPITFDVIVTLIILPENLV